MGALGVMGELALEVLFLHSAKFTWEIIMYRKPIRKGLPNACKVKPVADRISAANASPLTNK